MKKRAACVCASSLSPYRAISPCLALNFLVHGLDAWAAEWVGPQLTVQGKASRSDGDEAELLARGEAQRTLSARRSAVGAAAISYACQG